MRGVGQHKENIILCKLSLHKLFFRLLYPLIWILSKVLTIIPKYREAVKAIDGDREIRRLENLGEYEKARKLRSNLLKKFPDRHLGPLWRSEGEDQLYNQKNYMKALEAFENAISCIEGSSYISAFQYGITQPFSVYYGAAVSAIYVSDKAKSQVYYKNFLDLVSRSSNKEQYQEQIEWLKRQIDESGSRNDFTN